jgi:hypothetical protein
MIHIFTSVVNRPDFVGIQHKLFEKFLNEKYEFHVVDDSVDAEITTQFREVCESLKITYYRKPPANKPMNPAQACAHTVQWTYDNLIRKNHSEDIVFFLDSDMFLIDEFSIEEYMSDAIIAGLPQVRGHITYMWNGIMFFNMPKIEDKDIDFSDGMVDGEMTDVGGHTYWYFKNTGIEMKKTNEEFPTYPTHFNDIDLQKDSGGYNMELHLDDKFLHYRAATNWYANWKGSDDPLKKKTIIFNTLIENILND